jgi:hypothetical protein
MSITITNNYCTYCQTAGHLIHKCNDESIPQLHQNVEEIAAIQHYLFTNTAYLKFILTNHTVSQLRILGYKYNLSMRSQPNKLTYNFFIEQLIDAYHIIEPKTNQQCIDKIVNLSDTRIKTIIIDIIKIVTLDYISTSDTIEYIYYAIDQIRPMLKKHSILPCFIIEITEKIKKTENSDNTNYNCSICLEDDICKSDIITTNCDHSFCFSCVQKYFKSFLKNSSNNAICALCRTEITTLQSTNQKHIIHITNNYCLPDTDYVTVYNIDILIKQPEQYNSYVITNNQIIVFYKIMFFMFISVYIKYYTSL